MKLSIAILLALVVVGGVAARAQSDMIIKQRAKNLRDANNAQAGTPAGPAATPAPPAPPPAPVAPGPPPTQSEIELKQNLDKLAADLSTMKAGANVPGDFKQTLQADFSTLAKASVRPSTTNLNKLAGDLTSALSSAGAPREQGQLAQAINAIVNSSMITPAQAQTFMVVAQTSLKSSGVPDATVETITSDLKAILDEVQKKKPKLYQ